MKPFPTRTEPLVFDPGRRPGSGEVGVVRTDGSITFRGRRYADARSLPSDCRAFRADLASTLQWRRLYRAVDPGRRPGG